MDIDILSTLSKQETLTDVIIAEYYKVIPHDSLNLKTPTDVYVNSNKNIQKRKSLLNIPYNIK